jgi:hypothetical protein
MRIAGALRPVLAVALGSACVVLRFWKLAFAAPYRRPKMPVAYQMPLRPRLMS